MFKAVLAFFIIILGANSSSMLASDRNISVNEDKFVRASDLLDKTRAAIKVGKINEALNILNLPVFANSKTSDYYFLSARVNQELKRNVEALIRYSYSIALDSRNVSAFINRALVRGAMQDLLGAIEDLDAANNIQPQNPVVMLNRAVTYAGLNKTQLALRDFDLAIKLKPDYADAYRNRGIARYYTSDRIGACSDWAMAAKFGDRDAPAWLASLCTKAASNR